MLCVFALIYILIIYKTKGKVNQLGGLISSELTNILKVVSEGLKGIRHVIVDKLQPFYIDLYKNHDYKMRKANFIVAFISLSPKYILESTGMVIIAISAVFVIYSGVENSIPTLGIIALSAQRIMPLFQQIYSSLMNLRAGLSQLGDVLTLLESKDTSISEKGASVSFNNEIALKGLGFQYKDSIDNTLIDINLTINKGEKIGFIGQTGSGKSTLIDIILGLIEPINGKIVIDGKVINKKNMYSWNSHITHVSQEEHFIDSSFESNIALGIDANKVDTSKVKWASDIALISDYIHSTERKYKTRVGENGSLLSGGQRQRLAIARALYRGKDVLILDEATSALDKSTESEVIDNIYKLSSMTVIIITHNPKILNKCDSVYKLEKKRLVKC